MTDKRIGGRIALGATAAAILYLFLTSLAWVPAGTVRLYRTLTLKGSFVTLEDIPIVNDTERGRLAIKQPLVPGLGIGFRTGSYKIDKALPVSTTFAFYTQRSLTGNPEDLRTVRAFTISGTIAGITDWERFVRRLNPVQYNYDRGASPFSEKLETREEILAEQIELTARTADVPLEAIPQAGESFGNLNDVFNYWLNELISRRNFAAALRNRFGYGKFEQFAEYLEQEAPWYYYLGIRQFENLVNQGRELSESLQSVHYSLQDRHGQAERYILNEDLLLLINMTYRAYQYEQARESLLANLEDLDRSIAEARRALKPEAAAIVGHLLAEFRNFLPDDSLVPREEMSAFLEGQFNTFRQEMVLDPLINELRYQKLQAGLKNFKPMVKRELANLELSPVEEVVLNQVLEDLKMNYYLRLDPDEWETYQTAFNSIYQEYVGKIPDFKASENNEYLYWVYMSFLDYYLDDIGSRLSVFHRQIEASPGLSAMRDHLLGRQGILDLSLQNLVNSVYQMARLDADGIFGGLSMQIALQSQRETAESSLDGWEEIRERQLVPYFRSYGETLADHGFLWDEAVLHALEGPRLESYRDYRIAESVAGDTLQSIARREGADGFELFYDSLSELSFADETAEKWFHSNLGRRTWSDLYARLGKECLNPGLQLTVYPEARYSAQWWADRALSAEQRKVALNGFAYPVIEEHLNEGFDLFIAETPYLGYLEYQYGVKLEDVKIDFHLSPLYSNESSGVIDPDFYETYESELNQGGL